MEHPQVAVTLILSLFLVMRSLPRPQSGPRALSPHSDFSFDIHCPLHYLSGKLFPSLSLHTALFLSFFDVFENHFQPSIALFYTVSF